MAVEMEIVPGLVCGQTYRDQSSEQRVWPFRETEPEAYPGCGKSMVWIHTYRCRQCARWMHGGCLDKHFGDSDAD